MLVFRVERGLKALHFTLELAPALPRPASS
jgi:hypothetical protein